MIETKNRIVAIPTKYKGVQFRSRLEARWAAMFDLMGWEWVYEPFDAGGYIPDFLIDNLSQMIVEVKPLELENYLEYDTNLEWREVFKKMTKSGIKNEIAVVGCRVRRHYDVCPCDQPFNQFNASIIGMHTVYAHSCGEHYLDPAIITPRVCKQCGAISRDNSCDVNGCETGLHGNLPVTYGRMSFLWKTAGNLVQYKGAK